MNKMKKIIGITLLCGVLLSGCGKTQPEPETTQPESETIAVTEQPTKETVEENLARTVEVDYGEGTAYFEFNEKGLIVSEKNRPWGDSNAVYSYDEENRITEIIYANYDEGKYEDNERVVYEYDSDGNLIRENTYTLPEDKLVYYYEYEYENGKLVKKTFNEIIRGNIDSEEYFYKETEEGTEITIRNVSNDGSVGESKSTYDKDGKLILEEYPSGTGHTKYVYDESGKLIKEIYGDDEQEIVYEYENDVLVKAVYVKDDFSSEGYSAKGSYREFKYYDNGNIIAVYWYDSMGSLGEISIEAVPEVKGNFADITAF